MLGAKESVRGRRMEDSLAVSTRDVSVDVGLCGSLSWLGWDGALLMDLSYDSSLSALCSDVRGQRLGV